MGMGEKFVTVHPIGSDSLIILRQLYLRLRALSSTEFQKVAEELVTSWVVVVGRLLELIWEGVKTMDYRSATGTCIFHRPLPSQLLLLSLSAAMRRD